MSEGNTQPAELAEWRVILSGKFAFASNQLEEILLKKPSKWNAIRETVSSDTRAERMWESTELGEKERHWRMQMKKIEKMSSAIKTMLEVKNAEAYNQY